MSPAQVWSRLPPSTACLACAHAISSLCHRGACPTCTGLPGAPHSSGRCKPVPAAQRIQLLRRDPVPNSTVTSVFYCQGLRKEWVWGHGHETATLGQVCFYSGELFHGCKQLGPQDRCGWFGSCSPHVLQHRSIPGEGQQGRRYQPTFIQGQGLVFHQPLST